MEEWANRYDSPEDYWDQPTSLAVDDSGNVYVTGPGNGYASTIKYAPNGDRLWVARRDEPGIGRSSAASLVVDDSGNVYVTGTVYVRSNIDSDYVTIKYDPNGQQVWEAPYDGRNGSDVATSLAVDDLGNVYVTGSSRSTNT